MSNVVEVLGAALGSQYRIERELGGGGMSRVFVAEEVALGRQVAIKVLPPELSEGITAERFSREILLAAQLQHPHIVPLLSAGKAGGLLYYVMPYVEGESLRARLARDGTLGAETAVRIARDVAEALGYAHARGVVHRDIKPENIVLSSGHALVLDFGVAKALRAAGESAGATTAGIALGTPLYMAPEQAAGGGDVDGRADLYALGVVLYELLAGRPPFEGDSAYDLLAAHIADPPEPLRRRSAETPAALEAVVMRCLAKRASERHQSAGELVAELEALATRTGAGRVAGKRRGRGFLWAGVAAAAAAAAVVGARAAGVFRPHTLVAEGVLNEREPVILADFENRTPDSSLGIAVTEAFRVDLAQSSAVSVAPTARISSALVRMRRPSAPLHLALGQEVAQREGIRAVVGGEIAAVGTTYVVWAKIVNAGTGEVLAGFRATAENPGKIIGAVDRVSKQLRRRVGESLRRLETAPSLEQVTTGSLDALRAYSQGVRATYDGDLDRGVPLLEEAVRLDSSFASAYRLLAVAYINWDVNRPRQMEAFTQAFRLRDRLPERERQLITAAYYDEIDHRPELVIQAYESVLREDPADRVAVNNLALLYFNLGHVGKALPLFRRNAATNPSVMTLRNLLQAEFEDGSEAAADSLLGLMQAAGPNDPNTEYLRGHLAFARQQYDSATAAYRRLAKVHGETRTWRTRAYRALASVARLHGRVVESEEREGQAMRAATSHDTSGAELEVRLALLAASSDIEIRGLADRGVRRAQAAMSGSAWSSMSAVSRPYLDVAYRYAFAGRGELAQATLDERRRVLEQSGLAGRAALTADDHDPWYAAVRARTLAANGNLDSAIALLRSSVVPRSEVWLLPHLGALYDAAGRADSALVAYERFLERRALERHAINSWYRPRILFRLGELYEQRGDRGRAADYYSQFAELWRGADPDLQPRVAEARRRLAALTAEPGRQ